MMTTAGTRVTLDVVKPTAGGRMLARHNGQVILVWGAIPGERVVATIERVGKGVSFADVVEVVQPPPDRRAGACSNGRRQQKIVATPRVTVYLLPFTSLMKLKFTP